MTPRPAIPELPLSGGCLCGAVRYRLSARPRAVNACHCLDCKRQSGGDAAIFLHQADDSAIIERGETAAFRKTADSGRHIDIVRCAACGTRLWHKPLALPSLTLVSAGTLDDSSWAIPTSHIWMSRASGTTAIADDAVTFDLAAPHRQILWDHFDALYPL
jgi:hypothetical protein